jgi:hypothetical protein
MDWNILWSILVALAVVVVAALALWRSLRQGYNDYMACIKDGVVTDAEKIQLADDLLKAIDEARNVWSFIAKLILLFKQYRTPSGRASKSR